MQSQDAPLRWNTNKSERDQLQDIRQAVDQVWQKGLRSQRDILSMQRLVDGKDSLSLLSRQIIQLNNKITALENSERYYTRSQVDSLLRAILGDNVLFTPEGGYPVKMINKSGGVTVAGEVVDVYRATAINRAVKKIIVDVPDPIGVFYESGVADGEDAWVVVSGVAHVYFVGNTTIGHLARGFVGADAGYVTGQALSEAVPTSPFATDKHFYEIGHVMESRTGAGLALVNLHFN
jgi:hypothetical protein